MDSKPPQSNTPRYTRSELELMDIDDLDRMAFGVVGGQQIDLSPADIHIRYHCDLENPQALFDAQGMAWAQSVDLSESIEVSVDDRGDFYLEDGHHRWFAAGKTGRRLKATTEIKGKPIEKILADQAQAMSERPAPKAPRFR